MVGPDFTVHQHGIDSSGREILSTEYMWSWWEDVAVDLATQGVPRPTVIQGAFMSRVVGGGAKDSDGYHDDGGCFDLRTRDLTAGEIEQVVRTVRRHGAAAWRRDDTAAHGGFKDPHIHLLLGTDAPLADGAASQWSDYQLNRNGLADQRKDYEWRPQPLVLTPPEEEMTPEDIDRIADRVVAKLLDQETVDGESNVTVRQAINQTRRFAERAAQS